MTLTKNAFFFFLFIGFACAASPVIYFVKKKYEKNDNLQSVSFQS